MQRYHLIALLLLIGLKLQAQFFQYPLSAKADTICPGDATEIYLYDSQKGMRYYLKDSTNTIIDGPIYSTNGGTITFNTGPMNTSNTFNVAIVDHGGSLNSHKGRAFIGNDSRAIDSAVTIAVRIKLASSGSSFPNNRAILKKGFQFYVTPSGEVGIQTSAQKFVESQTRILDDQWHYIVGIIDRTTGAYKIYVDGILEGNSIHTNGGSLGNTDLGRVTYWGFRRSGYIDELTLWNRALSASEIQTYSNTCLTGLENGIVGHFPFNARFTDTIYDHSILGLHGTSSNTNSSQWHKVSEVMQVCPTNAAIHETITITVEAPSTPPTVNTSPTSICTGDTVIISLDSTIAGVHYSVWDSAQNTLAAPAQMGTGGSIHFNTESILGNTTYKVVSSRPKVKKNVLQLDGVDDYVIVGGLSLDIHYKDLNKAYSDITLAAWVKLDSTDKGGTIVDIEDLSLLVTNSGMPQLRSTSSGFWIDVNANGMDIRDGKWHYIVGTEDPGPYITTQNLSSRKLYVDGVLKGSNQDWGGIGGGNYKDWIIGATFNNGTLENHYEGTIGNVAIFNTAYNNNTINVLLNSCSDATLSRLPLEYISFDVMKEDTVLNFGFVGSGLLKNTSPDSAWILDPSFHCTDWRCQQDIKSIYITPHITPETFDTAYVCPGGDYTCHDGTTLTNIQHNHIYTSYFQAYQYPCDSLVHTTIIIEVNETFDTAYVCLGSDYTCHDGTILTNIQHNLTHTNHLQAYQYPCDSLVHTLIIPQINEAFEQIKLCRGESYTFPDGTTLNNIQSNMQYSSHIQSQNSGCDTIIYTIVKIKTTLLYENINLCKGDDYTFPDGTTSINIQSNLSHTSHLPIPPMVGCDTIIQTTITVPALDSILNTGGGILSAFVSDATYQWVDCNNNYTPIPFETNQSYIPSASGNYAVEVSDMGCTNRSKCIPVTDFYTSIYPNPVSDVLTIESNRLLTIANVYAMNGQLVKHQETPITEILVHKLPKGIYALELISKDGVINLHRFIKG